MIVALNNDIIMRLWKLSWRVGGKDDDVSGEKKSFLHTLNSLNVTSLEFSSNTHTSHEVIDFWSCRAWNVRCHPPPLLPHTVDNHRHGCQQILCVDWLLSPCSMSSVFEYTSLILFSLQQHGLRKCSISFWATTKGFKIACCERRWSKRWVISSTLSACLLLVHSSLMHNSIIIMTHVCMWVEHPLGPHSITITYARQASICVLTMICQLQKSQTPYAWSNNGYT